MKRIELVKTSQGHFIAANNSDYELIKKINPGDSVEAKFPMHRSLGYHKRFFALIRFIYHHMDESMHSKFPSEEALRLELTLQAGYWSKHVTLGDKEVIYPQSIRFDKMDQEEFQKLYSTIIDIVLKYFKLDVERDELINFM